MTNQVRSRKWWNTGDARNAWAEHDVPARLAEAIATEAAEAARWSLAAALDWLDSPIEKKLLVGLCACRETAAPVRNSKAPGAVPPGRVIRVWAVGDQRSSYPSETLLLEDRDAIDRIVIDCQKQVGPYAADFVVTWENPRLPGAPHASVYVEADGHDFHERTKRQAEHDKKRDRYFVGQGLKLLRFTGSEIHRDPLKCAREVFTVLSELSRAEEDRAREQWERDQERWQREQGKPK